MQGIVCHLLENLDLEGIEDPFGEFHGELLRFLDFFVHGLKLFEEAIAHHFVKLVTLCSVSAGDKTCFLQRALALDIKFLFECVPQLLVVKLELANLVSHISQFGL